MQLAFVFYKYFPFGGLQRDFMRIALECQARGHAIRVYTPIWEGEVPAGFDVADAEHGLGAALAERAGLTAGHRGAQRWPVHRLDARRAWPQHHLGGWRRTPGRRGDWGRPRAGGTRGRTDRCRLGRAHHHREAARRWHRARHHLCVDRRL